MYETPKCACGCDKHVSHGRRFVHGHHAKGRKKTDDEKRRIGEKNSVNMKRYMAEHPEVAIAKGTQLRSTWTDENERHRIERTKEAYALMSSDDKQKFSTHSKELWQRGTLMEEAHVKAATTFKERFAAGEYDFTERNDKLSQAISQKYVDGTWKFAKGTYVSTKTGKPCYFRSSWELQLMKELDADDDVINWENEPLSIPYEHLGSTHRYVPDFFVTRQSCQQLVEVKPMALRENVRNAAKRIAAEGYCCNKGWQYIEWSPR